MNHTNSKVVLAIFLLLFGAAVALELDTTYAPIHDACGNLVALVDTTGTPIESYRYTAFGETQTFNNFNNPWQYASKRLDPETGFLYFGRRYYIPDQGRWLTPDPAGFADGPNLYAYVHNHPLAYIDPDGQFAFLLVPLAISLVADYCLPLAVTALESYSGGTMAAAFLSGLASGYNDLGVFKPSAFQSDWSQFLCERAGTCLGTALMFGNPRKIGTNAAKVGTDILASEVCNTVTTAVANRLKKGYIWFKTGLPPNLGQGSIAQTTVKTSQVAERSLLAKEGVVLSRGAENVNAGVNLGKKLSQLEAAQQSAVNIRTLADGRIRYYGFERAASTFGPTRGRSYVTEFDPANCRVRTWMECYDHIGQVNRVHPKQINGKNLNLPHYPPTARELGL